MRLQLCKQTTATSLLGTMMSEQSATTLTLRVKLSEQATAAMASTCCRFSHEHRTAD
jgi:hypothetical protein